jgi:hypothetical protein
MQIKLTEQGGFDCCQVKQYEKECKGQTKNSRNSSERVVGQNERTHTIYEKLILFVPWISVNNKLL